MFIYQSERLTVFQSAMFQLNSAVVVTDDFILVSDPGYLPHEVEQIRRFVEEKQGSRKLYLFFTHSDFDHIVGYGAFPGATVIASKVMANHTRKPELLEWAQRYDDEFYLDRPYRLEFPTVNLAVPDDGLEIEHRRSNIICQPARGHNDDGVMLYIQTNFEADSSEQEPHILIAGDYLSDIEFPFIYHSYREYEMTMNRLKRLIDGPNPLLLTPGHGTVCDRAEALKRWDDANKYLELVTQLATNGDSDSSFEDMMTSFGYRYPLFQRKFHEGNLKIIREELE